MYPGLEAHGAAIVAGMANDALRVAALQLSSQQDVGENLAQCRRLVAEAGARGARLVLLPENFAFMGEEEAKRAFAERLGDGGPIQKTLSELAREHRVTVIAGGFPERSEDARRPFNSCVVFDPSGEGTATYRKIHLFDVDLPDGTAYRESAGSAAGKEPVVVGVDGFVVGLSICYDLRFP